MSCDYGTARGWRSRLKKTIELLLTTKSSCDKPWLLNLKTEIAKALRTHTLLICIILFYSAVCLSVAGIYGVKEKVSLLLYFDNLGVLIILVFLIFIIGRSKFVTYFFREGPFKQHILNDLRTNYLNTERLCNTLLVFFLLSIFLSAFTSFKIILPDIHPFSWDYTFAKWDAFIHGGKQPWELLQPILGRPFLTSTVSFFYHLWFLVMYGVICWQAFSLRNRFLRMQFLLTYALLWILLGTVTAIIFSSAGPCYYGRVVGGEDIYLPLMEYLRSAKDSYPVWALTTQEMLWQAYSNRELGQVKGISAMPSMHVSIAFLFVLVGWRAHRISGIVFSIFAFIIMLGCVHLGWHYAIDAYTSIVLTCLVWWAVSCILKRYGTAIGLETNQ